mgnify:CR=1 FL=1
MPPVLTKPLTLMQLIIGLSITIIGGAFSLGAAWASVTSDVGQVKIDVTQVKADLKNAKDEAQKTIPRLNRLERNVVSIGNKVGARVEDPE